jgi:diadenosine tetraphosphate (Ap4A) HIT family hydrolase
MMVESDRSVALADLSPLTLGHSLVVPRQHYFNISETLAKDGDGYLPFLVEFLDRYEDVFGSYALFEHGSTIGMLSSACISHAHLHVLPMPLEPVLERLHSDGLTLTQLTGWDDVTKLDDEGLPYFLASDGARWFVALDPPVMPSQYLRIAIGATLHISPGECDWAVVIRKMVHKETLQIWNSPGEVAGG